MIFSDFKLFYQTIYPGDENSPLKESINDTKVLELKYNQNIFSLKVSSINYDYPSNILYSWKLEGFYEEWSKPSSESIIRYTNLAPGTYTLKVRTISNEDKRIVLEERSMVLHCPTILVDVLGRCCYMQAYFSSLPPFYCVPYFKKAA